MSNKLYEYFLSELSIQIKYNNLIKYLFIFFAFCTFSVTFVGTQEGAQQFGITFAVISIPLALMNLSGLLFKDDIKDGSIEVLATIFSSLEIVIVKFTVLLLSAAAAFMLNLPLVIFIYNIDFPTALLMCFCGFLLCLSASSLVCLISAVQSYFRSNTNFISILIMPLIIPSIILIGLALGAPDEGSYINILLGINLVIAPISLYLSKYLLDNIYNI